METELLNLQGVQLHAEDITVLAGCGCVLDLLLFCIAADGDLVGIPAPYYPAFDNDLKVIPSCAYKKGTMCVYYKNFRKFFTQYVVCCCS